jgi:hypothetical protein
MKREATGKQPRPPFRWADPLSNRSDLPPALANVTDDFDEA